MDLAESAARFSNGNALRYREDGHPRQRFLTPPYIFEPARQALGGVIVLDPCTEPDNPVGAVGFYCPPVDGALEPWDAATIYVNPPYSRARERWVLRCLEAAAASTASTVVFIRGRIKFGVPRANGRQYAASHPSALIGWNAGLAPCRHLGLLVDLAGLAA